MKIYLEKLEQSVKINTDKIQALTEQLTNYQQEAKLERACLYKAMTDLSRAQSYLTFAKAHSMDSDEKSQIQNPITNILSPYQNEIVQILQIIAENKNS